MKLTQMAMFGVRGRTVRVRKNSPLVRDPKGAGRPAKRKGRDGKRGAAVWPALVWLAFAAAVAAVLMLRGADPIYPDPVCETCGKVLDGTDTACVPEREERTTENTEFHGRGRP